MKQEQLITIKTNLPPIDSEHEKGWKQVKDSKGNIVHFYPYYKSKKDLPDQIRRLSNNAFLFN